MPSAGLRGQRHPDNDGSYRFALPRAPRSVALFLSLGTAVAGATGSFGLDPAARAQHLHPTAQPGSAADHTQRGEGGEGGEGGEAGHSQAASSNTEVLVVLAQMQGHLLVAQELLSNGNAPGAEPHVGHPVDELYGSLETVIASGRLQPFRDSLELLRQQVRLAPASPGTSQKLLAAQRKLQAASNTVAPALNAQPALVLEVVRQLALTAASEYEAAVADGRIAETIEYQDARGFLLQARRLISQALTATPTAAASLHPAQTRLEAMFKAFPSVTPPQRAAVSVSQLRSLAAGI